MRERGGEKKREILKIKKNICPGSKKVWKLTIWCLKRNIGVSRQLNRERIVFSTNTKYRDSGYLHLKETLPALEHTQNYLKMHQRPKCAELKL